MMRSYIRRFSSSGILLSALCTFQGVSGAVALPPLNELREVIRTHVKDIPEGELDEVAGRALLERVQGRVLGEGELAGEAESDAPAVAAKQVFEPGCLYVRVGQVSLGLAPQLAAVLRDSQWTTGARGLVLDLRFAGGSEYAGAANTADLFMAEEKALIDWGSGVTRSTAKTNAWTLPVTVLVNRETRGSAEALAAVLRADNAALVIGSPTAGGAAVYREVPISGGRRLRLATSRVRVGEGQVMGAAGVRPDILVETPAASERAYLTDPYVAVVGGGEGVNRIQSSVQVKKRLTEAELVRQRRAGGGAVPAPSVASTATNAPAVVKVVRDPALARALDLIKGLAALGTGVPGSER